MAATNTKTTKSHIYNKDTRLAGGSGNIAAAQNETQELRRLTMACLLWEDIAYLDGVAVVDRIKELVPKIDGETISQMAIEARFDQKLRHVPLLLCREMARHESHRPYVAKTLARVVNRPDELAEFVAMFWPNGDRQKEKSKTLPRQVKKGLAFAFTKFDEYQLAKWNRDSKAVKLKDVLFLVHATPKDEAQANLWKRLIDDKLATPDTWEVGLSAAKSSEEKKAVWERLLADDKLGALAFLKNLRNMDDVGVSASAIAEACNTTIRPSMLLPIDFVRAAKHAPKYTREIENLMYRCAAQWPKLTGHTIFVVDVSGSMGQALSSKTDFSRMDAAAGMCVLAAEMCERVSIYATAGSDHSHTHKTQIVPAYRGFGLAEKILDARNKLGGGGIFTRQCLEYIRSKEKETPDRIVIFSDSQDCDYHNKKLPEPFGRKNYIVDVSNHAHGVNYRGVWTAEISGWSEYFLRFIAGMESQNTVKQ